MKGSQMDSFIQGLDRGLLHLEVRNYFDYVFAIFHCIKYFRHHKTQVVHCHLLKANLIGLSAAWILSVPERIYTRHHSTYHHRFSGKGVLLDRMINWLSTSIIAISRKTKMVLVEKENVPTFKVRLVPHGFDFKKMDQLALDRNGTQTEGHFPVIGVVSRFIEWKGVQYIIPAFKQLLKDYPKAMLLLIGGGGPYHHKIQDLLKQIPTGSFQVVGFEDNVYPLYKGMDVLVHVPIDPEIEAFGQIYIETSAMKVPSVFTLSGIAHEFVRDGENAWVVDYQNSKEITDAIRKILSDPEYAEKLGNQASFDIRKQFSVEQQANVLLDVYN